MRGFRRGHPAGAPSFALICYFDAPIQNFLIRAWFQFLKPLYFFEREAKMYNIHFKLYRISKLPIYHGLARNLLLLKLYLKLRDPIVLVDL